MLIDDLWAIFVVAGASFWVGIGAKRILESRWLRDRRLWELDLDLDGFLATPEEIEAARKLDLGRK